VNLPPGEHTKLFERIREVGKGYTVIGTNYTYNTHNQLVHRENLTRYEDYDYTYDDQGSLLTDSRSKFEWNALGQLTKVTFPDGFGEKYAYDMLGRRTSKTQFNHQGETQDVTNFTYKGDTWVITEERNAAGEITKSYTFDANDRPLSITFKGETFWYVYNGHGDVMAMTDKDGNIAARYEYDAWGVVTRMYNRYGERVREGIGWIGDLGTGNGSPGSLQGPEDSSGNTVPDYHPGNGNGKAKGNGKGATEGAVTEITAPTVVDSTQTSTVTLDLSSVLPEETEPTEDITTDLVKENPIRYAGYYFDRKTQYYYLQARYYDPRPARFISEDSYEGEIEQPQTLNLYAYVSNNPLLYSDPSGHKQLEDKEPGFHPYLFISVTTFIPDKIIRETRLASNVSGIPVVGLGRQLWEKGTFRTRHIVVVDLENGRKTVDSKDISDSRVREEIFGTVHSAGAPSGKTMKANVNKKSDGTLMVSMYEDEGSNLLKWLGLKITYNIDFTVDTSGHLTMKYKHKGFPAYEIVVNEGQSNIIKYGFNPRANWKNFDSLASLAFKSNKKGVLKGNQSVHWNG
jgi:RHS repeat-associated protein